MTDSYLHLLETWGSRQKQRFHLDINEYICGTTNLAWKRFLRLS
jgi:hypothetical protein